MEIVDLVLGHKGAGACREFLDGGKSCAPGRVGAGGLMEQEVSESSGFASWDPTYHD